MRRCVEYPYFPLSPSVIRSRRSRARSSASPARSSPIVRFRVHVPRQYVTVYSAVRSMFTTIDADFVRVIVIVVVVVAIVRARRNVSRFERPRGEARPRVRRERGRREDESSLVTVSLWTSSIDVAFGIDRAIDRSIDR